MCPCISFFFTVTSQESSAHYKHLSRSGLQCQDLLPEGVNLCWQVQQECLHLLDKNARLTQENEALTKQLRAAEPYKPASESLRTLKSTSSGISSQPSKSLFGKFGKNFLRR